MSTSDINASSGSKSRRDFLKLSGHLAAASALAGVAVPRCYAAENSTIKLALVGCGGRGTGAVADAFSTTGGPVRLYAMADLFEHRLQGSLNNLTEGFKDKLDVPPERRFIGFGAYKKAIDCLSPGDVVLLTTHAVFRPLHFEYAVAKGVNVFMEKSFAVDSPAVRRLLKAAEASEKKNLKVGVGFMWRHSSARQEVIRRIHDGVIGQVHTLRIYRVHGPVHCPPRPQNVNELIFQLQNPNSFTWVSSGFFIDWHCHNIDVACWAKGAWPVSAQGMGGRCYEQSGNQFDHYTVEYTFCRRHQAIRLLAPHERLLGDLLRLRPRLKGLSRHHDQFGCPQTKYLQEPQHGRRRAGLGVRPARLQPLPGRMAGASRRYP